MRPFGHGDHVGLVAVALRAEHRAQPPRRADDLLGDEQHAVLVADLAHAPEVAIGRGEASARVLQRFEHHRRDGLRSFEHDRLFDRVRGERHERVLVLGERVPVGVGVGDVHPARRQGLERRAEAGDARRRHRAHRRTVIRRLPGDDLVALRLADRSEVLARQLPRRLHRLRPTGREEDAVEIAGREPAQHRRQLDRRGMRERPDRVVAERSRLLGGRVGQPPATVPDLHREEPRESVELAVVVLVEDVATLAPHDEGNVALRELPELAEVHPEVPLGVRLQLVDVVFVAHRAPCRDATDLTVIACPRRRSACAGAGT